MMNKISIKIMKILINKTKIKGKIVADQSLKNDLITIYDCDH